MVSLYELNGRAGEIERELEHTEDPQLKSALLDELDALYLALDDKLEAYCVVIKNLDAERDAIDLEIVRLRNKSKALETTTEELIKRLKSTIGEGTKWGRGVHSISWRKSTAVKIVDEKAIPVQYLREILKYEPDKKLLLEDLKCKATIPGATLEERFNLTIK